MKRETRNVVLLRVGIDKGCGGCLGPIFRDHSFEFIPIPNGTQFGEKKYSQLPVRNRRHERFLSYFLPDPIKKRLKNDFAHQDPDFNEFTYGDPTTPKASLRCLKKGDILAFYAGLSAWDSASPTDALYLVGYFVVEKALRITKCAGNSQSVWVEENGTWNKIHKSSIERTHRDNWHVRHSFERDIKSKSGLVIVKGGSQSRFFRKAVQISENGKDCRKRRVFVLGTRLKRYFGTFTKLNAIQRSIPRWVDEQHAQQAWGFLSHCQKRCGR